MIRVLFLDVDDTVLDFVGFTKETMKSGFRKFGYPEYVPWMYDTFHEVNGGIWRDHEKGLITFEDIQRTRWTKVFHALGFEGDGPEFESYFRSCLHESGLLIPGAKKALEHLSEDYLLFAATNGPDEQQKNRLRKAGVLKLFCGVFTSEAIGATKPSAEFFDGCIEIVNGYMKEHELPNIHKDEILMVGDSLTSDIGGAVAYGLKSCLFDPTGEKFGKIEGTDYEVKNWSEITDVLKK